MEAETAGPDADLQRALCTLRDSAPASALPLEWGRGDYRRWKRVKLDEDGRVAEL